MDEKKAFQEFITKALGIKSDELATLIYQKVDGSDEETLKDDAVTLLLAKNADKIAEIKQKGDDKFDNGHKKGMGEALDIFEKKVKEELGFNSDLKGVELVKAYGDSIRELKPDKPTDDQVKKHALYIELEKSKQTEKDEAVRAVQEEFDNYKNGVTKKEQSNKVNSKAWDIVTPMNPVIEGKPGENQRKNFLNSLGIYNYEESNGTFIVTDPNNNDARVEDSQGNAKSFEQLVAEHAKDHFIFSKQGDKGSAGNGNDPPADGSVIKIESKEDFARLMKDANGDLEKEAKYSAAWKTFQEK